MSVSTDGVQDIGGVEREAALRRGEGVQSGRVLRPYEIAERRALLSEQPRLFMRGYQMGKRAARTGEDLDACDRRFSSCEMSAGFIEGAAAYRARTAKPADYMPGSAGRVLATRRAV